MQDGEFWGLIACHNKTPRIFDLFEADFYKTAGELLSNRLTELSSLDTKESHAERISLAQELVSDLNKTKKVEMLITPPKTSTPFGNRLFPRTSFELWKEVKKGHASP